MIGRSRNRPDLADRPHRVVAVHVRHHDVHQDDVDVRRLLELLDRLLAGLGRDDVHAAARSSTLVIAKMLRMSSSTISTFLPGEHPVGRVESLDALRAAPAESSATGRCRKQQRLVERAGRASGRARAAPSRHEPLELLVGSRPTAAASGQRRARPGSRASPHCRTISASAFEVVGPPRGRRRARRSRRRSRRGRRAPRRRRDAASNATSSAADGRLEDRCCRLRRPADEQQLALLPVERAAGCRRNVSSSASRVLIGFCSDAERAQREARAPCPPRS